MALKVREHCIKMSGNGGAFTGSALACADLLAICTAGIYLSIHATLAATIVSCQKGMQCRRFTAHL